jgi:preprotein translocase subunit YajC
MLIQKAYAEADIPVPLTTSGTQSPAMPETPSGFQLMTTNMTMVLVLVVLFYLLLIKPQQKRFREHSKMLSALQKGDKVVTGGGLIGTVDKIGDGDEVIVDLGGGVKVTALRSSIQGKDDPLLRRKAANDLKENKKADQPQ